MKSAAKTLSMALCAVFVLTPLAASSDEAFDIQSQVGPNPVLPDIQQGSYSGICWYGPFPMAPLIQFGG
jgi:hypothetical protein